MATDHDATARAAHSTLRASEPEANGGNDASGASWERQTRRCAFPEPGKACVVGCMQADMTSSAAPSRSLTFSAGGHQQRLADGLRVADYARIQNPRTHAALIICTRASHLAP